MLPLALNLQDLSLEIRGARLVFNNTEAWERADFYWRESFDDAVELPPLATAWASVSVRSSAPRSATATTINSAVTPRVART